MKKLLAMITATCLMITMLAGCTATDTPTVSDDADSTELSAETTNSRAGTVTNGMYYDGTPIEAVLDSAPELYITIPPAVLEWAVTFENPENGETLAGIIRTPLEFEGGGWGEEPVLYPTLVFNGPIGSVKDQTASTYAQWMSSLGYVTLVFDNTSFGESTGEPRRVEGADIKISDIHAAVDYLLTLSYVDPERIAGVGICGGGGYMAAAVSENDNLVAYAGISPFGMMGEGGGGFGGNPEEAEAARAAYEAGEAPATYGRPIQPGSLESSYYLDPRRGSVPTYHNIGSVTWSSLYSTEYNLQAAIENLAPKPLLVVAPEQYLMETAEQMYETYTGEDKEYYVLKGASHYETYDLEPWVGTTVGYMEDFFGKYL